MHRKKIFIITFIISLILLIIKIQYHISIYKYSNEDFEETLKVKKIIIDPFPKYYSNKATYFLILENNSLWGIRKNIKFYLELEKTN